MGLRSIVSAGPKIQPLTTPERFRLRLSSLSNPWADDSDELRKGVTSFKVTALAYG